MISSPNFRFLLGKSIKIFIIPSDLKVIDKETSTVIGGKGVGNFIVYDKDYAVSNNFKPLNYYL